MSKPTETPAITCPATGIASKRDFAIPNTLTPVCSPANEATPPFGPEASDNDEAVEMSAPPSATLPRILVPLENPAAPWKRLNAAATAPPSGISPIASRPAVAAPLAGGAPFQASTDQGGLSFALFAKGGLSQI